MAAAIALAVVLVIAVAGLSLAMQTQRPLQPPGRPRNLRPTVAREGRPRRPNPRPVPVTPPPVDPEPAAAPPVPRGPELLRTGVPAEAQVVSVVDERVVGPVTRSRLTLRLEPEGREPLEVTIRHAFPSSEARAAVRVGGRVAVRYDRERPAKVVIDTGRADDQAPPAEGERPSDGPEAPPAP